jgi:hypothetical protein
MRTVTCEIGAASANALNDASKQQSVKAVAADLDGFTVPLAVIRAIARTS